MGTFEARIARGPRRELVGACERLVEDLALEERLATDTLAGHQKPLGSVHAHQQGPDHLPTVTGADPHLDVRVAEDGTAVGDDDVAEQGDRRAEAHRVALHRRDDRLAELEQVTVSVTTATPFGRFSIRIAR